MASLQRGPMSFSREVGQVLRSSVDLRGAAEPAAWVKPLSAEGLHLVGRAAAYHGVAGYVHQSFAATNVLPKSEREWIARARERTVQAHLWTMADLEHLGQVLDRADVPWMIIKGPTLALPVHGKVALRSYGDLDALVEPHRLGDAIEALEASGCELLDRNWTLFRDVLKGEVHLVLPTGTKLDLHWHLINDRSVRDAFSVDLAGVFDRRCAVEVDAISIPTLGPADTVVYVAMHAVLSGADRLIWLKDVERLVTLGDISADAVLRRARDWGAELALAMAMTRAAAAIDGFTASDAFMPRDRRSQLLITAAERVWQRRPLEREDGDGSAARMLSRSARPGPGATTRALVAKGAVRAKESLGRGEGHRGFDAAGPGSASYASGGDAARRAFLDAVGSKGGPWVPESGQPRASTGDDDSAGVDEADANSRSPLQLRADGIHWQELDGMRWVFDARTTEQFRVNGTGACLIDLLDGGTEQQHLVAALMEQFGAQQDVATRDVASFLAMLDRRGLLVTRAD